MSNPLTQIIWDLAESILSKPSEQRDDADLEHIICWFRQRSPLFKLLEDDALLDIIKNVTLTRYRKDNIIMRQGEKGNCFYIILKGSVSVYAKQDGDGEAATHHEQSVRSHKERLLLFGAELSSLRAGRSFGEMVMVDERKERNTTVIADEATMLISIDEKLYERSLYYYSREWKRKVEFVKTSPIFASWPSTMKTMLVENLKAHRVNFEAMVVRQNEPCGSVYFIADGLARVTLQPSIAANQFQAWKKAPARKQHGIQVEDHNSKNDDEDVAKMLTVIQKRRKRQLLGYAAMERRLRARTVCVAVIGQNDIIGGIEMILDLPAYCASVECLESLECYELDKAIFHRLAVKRNPETLKMIGKVALTKLKMRADRLSMIPLYQFLVEKAKTVTLETNKTKHHGKKRKLALASVGRTVTSLGIVKSNTVNKGKLLERLTLGSPATGGRTSESVPARPSTAPSTGGGEDSKKGDSKRRNKKDNKKQYTAEEFRALKKKVQSTGKMIGRVSD